MARRGYSRDEGRPLQLYDVNKRRYSYPRAYLLRWVGVMSISDRVSNVLGIKLCYIHLNSTRPFRQDI